MTTIDQESTETLPRASTTIEPTIACTREVSSQEPNMLSMLLKKKMLTQLNLPGTDQDLQITMWVSKLDNTNTNLAWV